jgi:NTE family protein
MAYEIGVLRALQDIGLDPQSADLVIGTSCGAFVGAALRNDVPWETLLSPPPGALGNGEGLSHLEKGWQNRSQLARRVLGASGVLASSVMRLPLPAPSPRLARAFPGGLFRVRYSEDIPSTFGTHWPDRPLWLMAMDVHSRRRRALGREPADRLMPLSSALLASSAVPALFEPVKIDGHWYVDGGLRSSTNLDIALRTEARRVVCVAPMGYSGDQRLSLAHRALRGQTVTRMRRDLARPGAKDVLVLTMSPGDAELAALGSNPMRADGNDLVAEQAHDAALRMLEEAAGQAFLNG